jgi:hypothetical protein
MHPKQALLDGVEILEKVLLVKGFAFQFRKEGRGSGGEFAWGEFVREGRRLEVHFQYILRSVRYHASDQSASHESYMRELGVWSQCLYPGFWVEAGGPFPALAHDLGFAEDFLSGSATILRSAAAKEALATAARHEALMSERTGPERD